jgi:hypothetical protein
MTRISLDHDHYIPQMGWRGMNLPVHHSDEPKVILYPNIFTLTTNARDPIHTCHVYTISPTTNGRFR